VPVLVYGSAAGETLSHYVTRVGQNHTMVYVLRVDSNHIYIMCVYSIFL